jgi:hypothetical protein
MLSERVEIAADLNGESVALEALIHQTNDAPEHWGFLIVDPAARSGGRPYRLYETLFGLGSGLEERLGAGQLSFGQYVVTGDSVELLYERAVAVGAMAAREVIIPDTASPGPRLRLSPLAERRLLVPIVGV